MRTIYEADSKLTATIVGLGKYWKISNEDTVRRAIALFSEATKIYDKGQTLVYVDKDEKIIGTVILGKE